MMGSWLALIVVVLAVLGPLAWSMVKDRRAERALSVRAEIQYAVDRRLGGTSYPDGPRRGADAVAPWPGRAGCSANRGVGRG